MLLKGTIKVKVPPEAEVEAEVKDKAGAEVETTTKAMTNAQIKGLYHPTNALGV